MRAFRVLKQRTTTHRNLILASTTAIIGSASLLSSNDSINDTLFNDSNINYFKHKLGRIFPNFYDKQQPNWTKIKYSDPETIMNRNESCSKYIEPETPPSNEFILNTLHFLRDNIIWQKRDDYHDIAWYVENGCECDYEYDIGNPQPYVTMPQWMLNLRDSMCDTINIDKINNAPNACNINFYFNGNAGIGTHADNEDLFQGLEMPINIISYSIGAEREFEIYEIQHNGQYILIKSILLKNMSYLTMEGMFQKNFKHAVPRYDGNDIDMNKIDNITNDEDRKQEIIDALIENVGPRINMTWRWITKHAPNCPLSSA